MKLLTPRRLFFIILLISFLVRIDKVDLPLSFGFAWGDGTRDYLVANHILKYHEFPSIGPYNLLFDSGIYNSPLYFYLLAVLLVPFNHILTLSIVNILLQLMSIALIYLIAKNMFGERVGAVAAIFFSFNPQVLHQSDFIWQPNLMQPLALLALYFLIQKHLVSFFLLAFAAAVHHSAFSWIPFFLLLPGRKYYVWGSLILFFMFVVVYLPSFSKTGFSVINLGAGQMIVGSFAEYFANFISNMREFFGAFGTYQTLMLSLSVVSSLIYFLKFKDQPNSKKLTLFVLILFLAPIVGASFFNKVRLHYLILSFGAFSVLAAKVFISLSLRRCIFFRVFFFALLILLFTANFAFIKQIKKPLSNQMMMDHIVSQTHKELTQIQKEEGFADFSFFQIHSIALTDTPFYYPILDTILLVPLEEKLNQSLSRVSDNAYNHFQIGGNKYLLLSCYKFKTKITSTECLQEFTTQFPKHQILKSIYKGDSIFVYLTRK